MHPAPSAPDHLVDTPEVVPLRVLVAYDHPEAAHRGLGLLDRLRTVADDCDLQLRLWRLDLLADPCGNPQIRRDLGEVDLIILTLDEGMDSSHATDWLALCLEDRTKPRPSLIVLERDTLWSLMFTAPEASPGFSSAAGDRGKLAPRALAACA